MSQHASEQHVSSQHKGKGPINPKQGEETKVMLNRAASQDLAQPG